MNLAEVVFGNSHVQIVGRNALGKMADHSISGTMNILVFQISELKFDICRTPT